MGGREGRESNLSFCPEKTLGSQARGGQSVPGKVKNKRREREWEWESKMRKQKLPWGAINYSSCSFVSFALDLAFARERDKRAEGK